MLIVAISGFRPLKIYDDILKGGPNIFQRVDELQQDLYRKDLEVLKINYRNIIYTNPPKDVEHPWGVRETLEKIHEMIERDHEKKIIIIGYSLGGWGATVLAHYLKNGYKDGSDELLKLTDSIPIDKLVLIDALSIVMHSPIITESNWSENIAEEIGGKLKIFDKILQIKPTKKIIGSIMDFGQNLMDEINDDEITRHYSLECNQNLARMQIPHQMLFGENQVDHHLNYYVSDETTNTDPFAALARVATGVSTGPLPIASTTERSPIINQALNVGHLKIDDSPEIYQNILRLNRVDYQYQEMIAQDVALHNIINKYSPILVFHPEEVSIDPEKKFSCSYPSDPAEYYQNTSTEYGYNDGSSFIAYSTKPSPTTTSFPDLVIGKDTYKPSISIAENLRKMPQNFVDDGKTPCFVQCWKSVNKINDKDWTFIQIKYWFWNRYNDHPSDDISAPWLQKAISWTVQKGLTILSLIPILGKRWKGKDHKHILSHEGDWEHLEVRVTLDDNGKEVAKPFYYFSQHTWNDFTKNPHRQVCSNTGDEIHPVIYVALGSHASYKSPKRWDILQIIDKVKKGDKSLIWETCKKLEFHSQSSVASNIVYEFTGKWGGSPHSGEGGESPGGPASKNRFENQKQWQGENRDFWPGIHR